MKDKNIKIIIIIKHCCFLGSYCFAISHNDHCVDDFCSLMNHSHIVVVIKSLSRVWLLQPMDCSLPCSSIHGFLQARILEWVAVSFSRGSSQPRNRTQVSCIAGRFFTNWAMREVQSHKSFTAVHTQNARQRYDQVISCNRKSFYKYVEIKKKQ